MLYEKGEYAMVKLTKRAKGQGIFRVQTCVPGKLFTEFPVEKSETVFLHYKDRSVVVKDIWRKADGKFVGAVLGFEPPAVELGDLRIGDSVTFSEDDVISAARKD